MTEQCEGCGMLPGYLCAICQKNTCPNCDTYYYVIGGNGLWIDNFDYIMELEGTSEGHVAHQNCVDHSKLVNLEDY